MGECVLRDPKRKSKNFIAGAVLGITVFGLLCLSWRLWPFRLLYVDLVFTRHHLFTLASREEHVLYWQVLLNRFDWLMLLNLLLTGACLGFVAVIRRTSRGRRHPKAATVVALAAAAVFLMCLPVAYSRAKEALKLRDLARDPSRVVIEYAEVGRLSRALVVAGPQAEWTDSRAEGYLFDAVPAEERTVWVVSDVDMEGLLRIMRSRGFFQMELSLHPYGTIDGRWTGLRVSNGGAAMSSAPMRVHPGTTPSCASWTTSSVRQKSARQASFAGVRLGQQVATSDDSRFDTIRKLSAPDMHIRGTIPIKNARHAPLARSASAW